MRGAGESFAEAPHVLRACSACAGDYEDPERTAEEDRSEDSEIESTQDEELARADDFPASQEEERRTGYEISDDQSGKKKTN